MNKKLSIIYLFEGSYPEGMAMTKRLHCYAKALELEGAEQLIINQISSKVDSSLSGNYNGIEYININNPFVRKKNPIAKRLSLTINKWLLLVEYFKRRNSADICFYIGSSIQLLLILKLVTKLSGKKLVTEVNEYPYVTYGNGKFDFKILSQINRFIALNFIYKYIDGFIAISDPLYDLLNNIKKNRSQIINVPILIMYEGQSKSMDRFKDPYIFHAGTLTEQKDGIINVFKAFAKVSKRIPELKFVLTNKTTVPMIINKINSIIVENDLQDKVVFLDHINISEVERHMENCTLSVINKPDTIQNRYNFSTKLGEYLYFGIPVISTSIGEANKYLVDNKNCMIIQPNDIDGMADKIEYIINNKEFASKLSDNAKELARNSFDFKIHSKRLFDFFINLNTYSS
jgi:glycosyltransferase involved in cell wall biosynthesis